MMDSKCNTYILTQEEIKARYGVAGEHAEDRDAEQRQTDNDLYGHQTATIRRMVRGKRRAL